MIASWRTFIALPATQRRLVSHTAVVMALVWTGLRVLRFSTLRQLLERYAQPPVEAEAQTSHATMISGVRWATAVVAARMPSATCLVQALVAHALLRRQGVACELRIGVRLIESGAVPIEGHAWVERDGVVIVGAIDNLPEFKVLVGHTTPWFA